MHKMETQTVQEFVGKKVLFVGNESIHYNINNILEAAAYAKKLGFDSICVKRFDGEIKYYDDVKALTEEKREVNALGIGLLGFGYCYGPRFGLQQLKNEISNLHDISDGYDGCAVADLEIEFDNNPTINGDSYAKLLGIGCKDIPFFIVSTWADPIQQRWNGVIEDLDPYVCAWGPQSYGVWLAQQYTQRRMMHGVMFPEISLWSQPYDSAKITIANEHVESLWIWEYQGALQMPTLTKTVISLMDKPIISVKPPPTHITTYNGSYIVQNGDTLTTIAHKLGISESRLYNINIETITKEAALFNKPNNGNYIFPGMRLFY